MYFDFDCCDHHYRVLSNGMTLRKNSRTGAAESLSLSETQRRIMNELVRAPADEPLTATYLVEACLGEQRDKTDDGGKREEGGGVETSEETEAKYQRHQRRLKLLSRQARYLRAALKCDRLVQSHNIVRGNQYQDIESATSFSLGAEVRTIDEAKDWEPMTSATQDTDPIVNHVLIESDWFLPRARHSGASVEVHEVGAGRSDTAVCIIGYESDAFDTRSLQYFISEYEPSSSGLLEWAGVRNPNNLENQTAEVDGTREVMVLETKPQPTFRLLMGATGARLKLTWKSGSSTRIDTNGGDRPAFIRFSCGGTDYSLLDGTTRVEKHLPDGTKRILKLQPLSARLLSLFLARTGTGAVSNEEIWQVGWPGEEFTQTRSAKTIRTALTRLRKDLGSTEIVRNTGTEGRYALKAQLLVPLDGHGRLIGRLPKMPIRLLLPGMFVLNGPAARTRIRLREIKALGRDGVVLTLGLAPDAMLSSVRWLLNSKSWHGRLYLSWAGLDPEQPQQCTRFGDFCVVGDHENSLVVFVDDTLTAEWTSLREPAPNSAMAALKRGE